MSSTRKERNAAAAMYFAQHAPATVIHSRESSMTGLINWDCEYTDTFAGEANYCWVKRESLSLPAGLSQRQIMRKAKAALGLSGMRGRTLPYSDGFEFRPYRSCTVAFVTPRY